MSALSDASCTRFGRSSRAPRVHAGLLLLAPLLLGGCYNTSPMRENAGQYRTGFTEQMYTVAFLPQQAEPTPENRAALDRLRSMLPVVASTMLRADGPLAEARASAVSRALRRPVTLETQVPGELGRDEAVMVLTETGIVADACDGAGQPVGRNLWTPDDDRRQRLLPPGCANATMLLEQTANRQDVLRGRPLEPGAAGPIARAADRYLRRNDERPARREGRPGSSETSEEQESALAQTPAPGSDVQATPPSLAIPQQGGPPPASTPLTPR